MPSEQAESDEVEPELNMEIVNQLLMMGIPEVYAKHAVYNTGNNSADMASMWFFENIENPAIQVPLRLKSKASNNSGPK